MQVLKLKIDVTKINKAKLFTGKNGAKYLDATVFLKDEDDQYGNRGMITQDVSKEERESGVKGAILGNVKVIKRVQETVQQSKPNSEYTDDLPF